MDDKKRPAPKDETSTERFFGAAPEPVQPPSSRGVTLVIYHSTGDERATLDPGRTLVVGRVPPVDLVIPDSSLSRRHATFSLLDGRIFVEDLDSTNGTWIGKRQVKREEIAIGAEVTLGHHALARVLALGAAGDPAVEDEVAFRRRLADEVERAAYCKRSFAVLAARASEVGAMASTPWAARLRRRLRPIDRVGLYTPMIVLALLPEAGLDEARDLARAVTSERDVEGAPWRVGVAVYPGTSLTAEGLIEKARAAADGATLDEPVASASTALWTEIREDVPGGMIAGAAMNALLEQARQVAPTRLSVLIHGETGTGKELLAGFIHEQGSRRSRPIVRVNCGAFMASLLGSTLFGHEKGSFTGAEKQQMGLFEAAHRGTLFLDEIGELTLEAQAALLRVLDTGKFSRMGSTQEVKVDVRIIAATHRDLKAMVEEERFRRDLYFRLSQMVLEIPPLRQRTDELSKLTEYLLHHANRVHGRRVRGFTDEAMALLRAYPWPGNIRELSNAIEVAVVMARGDRIWPENLPPAVRAASVSTTTTSSEGLKAEVQRLTAKKVEEALRQNNWNREAAARQLNTSVSTLSRRMKAFGIHPPKR